MSRIAGASRSRACSQGVALLKAAPLPDPADWVVESDSGLWRILENDLEQCVDHVSATPASPDAIAAALAFVRGGTRGQLARTTATRAVEAKAFHAGERRFRARRGRLDQSCAECHVHAAGKHRRDRPIPTALGLGLDFPALRRNPENAPEHDNRRWVTLYDLFAISFQRTRARAAIMGGDGMRALEYRVVAISRGLPAIAPGVRP